MKFQIDQLFITQLDALPAGAFYRIVGSMPRPTVFGLIVNARQAGAKRRVEKDVHGAWRSHPIPGDALFTLVTSTNVLEIRVPDNVGTAGPVEQSGVLVIAEDQSYMTVFMNDDDRLVLLRLNDWTLVEYGTLRRDVRFYDWSLVDVNKDTGEEVTLIENVAPARRVV